MFNAALSAAAGGCLFLSACATTLPLQIKRAPEINLAEVRVLRLEPFEVSGRLATHPENDLAGGVPGTDPAAGDGEEKNAEAGNAELRQSEWAELKAILLEDGYYRLNEGGAFDARITGTIAYTVGDIGAEKSSQDKAGRVTCYFELVRTAGVEMNIVALDRRGTVVGVAKLHGSAQDKARGANAREARAQVRAWDELVRAALAQTHEPFLRKIAPYFITEPRTFENGESDFIRAGNQAAAQADWAAASAHWKNGATSPRPKDRIAAIYNLGLLAEAEGRLADALSKFEEARRLSGDAKYSGEITRILTRIEEDQKLRQLTAPTLTAPAPVAVVSAVSAPIPAEPYAKARPVDGPRTWERAPEVRVVRDGSFHRFNWTPLPGAGGYHLDAAKNPRRPFKALNRHRLAKPQLRVKVLPRGRIFVRVRACDKQGRTLAQSAVKVLVVP